MDVGWYHLVRSYLLITLKGHKSGHLKTPTILHVIKSFEGPDIHISDFFHSREISYRIRILFGTICVSVRCAYLSPADCPFWWISHKFAPDAELVGFSDREGGLGPAQRKASVTHPAWRQG